MKIADTHPQEDTAWTPADTAPPEADLAYTCEPNGVSIPGNRVNGVYYRAADGSPVGDNSFHFDWITLLANKLRMVDHGRDDVTLGGNLLWYP